MMWNYHDEYPDVRDFPSLPDSPFPPRAILESHGVDF